MGLFTPAWKDKDEKKALAYIEKCENQEKLAQIARETSVRPKRREAALKKLTDQKVLEELALTDEEYEIRDAAASKLTDQEILMEIARSDKSNNVRETARERITDKDKQIELALADGTPRALSWVVGHIPPYDARLLEIALKGLKGGHPVVCREAIEKMTDPELLRQAAAQGLAEQGLGSAAEKLTEKEDLLFAAKRNGCKAILKRMRELGYLDEKTLQDIMEEAEYTDLSNVSLELDKTRFLDDLEKKRLYHFKTAYEKHDVDMLRKEPAEESIEAVILLLREYGEDRDPCSIFRGPTSGPSDLAYKCSDFLHDMYRLHPELRDTIKKVNSYSINAHEDHGRPSCHEDNGPLIFDFK